MKRNIKRFSTLMLSLALLGTTFRGATSALENEVPNYSNDHVNVTVNKKYNQTDNVLDLELELEGKQENVAIDNITFPDENKKIPTDLIKDPEETNKDNKYKLTVTENGDYEFQVDYTIDVEVPVEEEKATKEVAQEQTEGEETNAPVLGEEETEPKTRIVERKETHTFKVSVDSIADLENEEPITTEVDESNKTETTENNDSTEPETYVDDKSDETEVTEKNDDKKENEDVIVPATPFAGESLVASLAGVNLDGVTSTNYTYLDYTTNTSKILAMNAKFSGTGTRVVRFNVGKEFSITSAPGMVINQTNNTMSFDASTLPQQYKGIILSAKYVREDSVHPRVIKSDGVLEYELVNTVSEFNLNLVLTPSIEFTTNLKGNTINDSLSVTTLIGGVIQESVKLGTIIHTGITATYLDKKNAPENGYPVEQTKGFESGEYNFSMSHIGVTYATKLQYAESYSIKFKFSNDLVAKGIKFNGDINPISTSYRVVESTATHTTVEYTFRKIVAYGLDKIVFLYDLAPGVDPMIRTFDVVSVAPTGGTVENIYGETEDQVSSIAVRRFSILIIAQENKVEAHDSSDDISIIEKDHQTEIPLGRFDIENQMSQSVTDQKMKATFDTVSIGVTSMTIKAGQGKAYSISGITTKGRTFTYGDIPKGATRRIDMKNSSLGGLQQDEYISEITWIEEEMISGHRTWLAAGIGGQYFGENVLKYSGIIKNNVPMPLPNKSVDSVQKLEVIQKDDTNVGNTQVALSTLRIFNKDSLLSMASDSPIGDTSIISGQKTTLSGRWFMANRSISPLARTADGVNLYFRELEGLHYYFDTLKLTDINGTIYTVDNNKIEVVELVDNMGYKVYRVVVKDYFGTYNRNKSQLKWTMDISTSKTAPTFTYQASELFFLETLTERVLPDPQLRASNSVYGISDIHDTFTHANASWKISNTANIDFQVGTASQLDGGAWTTYDGTPETVLTLNPLGEVKYKLEVANTSGQDVLGYKAIIPIPKAGATTGEPLIQSEAFGWDVVLNEAIDITSTNYAYNVKYATTYETNFTSPNWKSWNEVKGNPNAIRMIRIETTNTIKSSESGTPDNPGVDEIIFNLSFNPNTANQQSGKVNTYSALIERNLGGIQALVSSQPISIKLQTGIIEGKVVTDTGKTGVITGTEPGVKDVIVIAYEKGNAGDDAFEIGHTKTLANGTFQLRGLDETVKVDLVIKNPKTDDSLRFSTTHSTVTNTEATIKDITPSAANARNILAGLMSPYKITVNGGVSGQNSSLNRYPGEKVLEADLPELTVVGSTLLGWSDNPANITISGKVTFPLTISTDKTLYAIFGTNAYTVEFNANTGTGTMTNQVHQYGTEQALTANAFAKTGYSFTGWAESANGAVKYTDGQLVKNLLTTGKKTLYAVWKANTYSVKFNANTGTGTMANQSFTYNEAKVLSANTFTKPGYSFTGWAETANGAVKYTDIQSVTNLMTSGVKDLYAKWEVNTYTVSFDKNGGTGTMAAQTFTYDVQANLSTNTFVKADHTFKGWATTAAGAVVYTDKQAVKNLAQKGDFKLFAIYERKDEVANWELKAEDFTTTVDKVTNAAGLIKEGKAKVINKVDGSDVTTLAVITPNPTSLKEGTNQSVTYTVKRKSDNAPTPLTKTIKANIYTVMDATYGIIVNPITAQVDDVNTVTRINTEAGAKIFKLSTNTVDTTQQFEHKVNNTVVTKLAKGVGQAVTFTVKNRPSLTKTVNADIFGTIVGNQAMSIKDEFTIALPEMNKEKLKEYSGVKAWDITDKSAISEILVGVIDVTSPNPLPQVKGEVTFTFATPQNKTTITSKGNVVDTSIKLDVNNYIVLELKDSKLATEASLKTAIGAQAELAGTPIEPFIEAADVTKITSVTVAQDAPITITVKAEENKGAATGDKTSKDVKVYIVDKYNPTSKVGIKANSFVLDVERENAAEFRSASGVKAWDFSSLPAGEPTQIAVGTITVEKGLEAALKGKLGAREVIFKALTNNGTATVTVTGTMFSKIIGDYALDVKPEFIISKNQITEAEVLRLSGVKGWDIRNVNDIKPVAANKIKIKNPLVLPTEIGKHDITFEIDQTSTTAVSKMEVVQTQVVLKNDRNIVMTLADAKIATAESITNSANATAKLGTETIIPTISVSDLARINNVTIAQAAGIEIQLTATALNLDTTSNPVTVFIVDAFDTTTKIAINADSFAVELADVNEDKFKTESRVRAWDISTLPNAAPQEILKSNIFVTEGLNANLGKRDVEFTARTTTKEKAITVKGFVFSKITGTVAIDVDKEFTIASKEVTETKVKELSHVKAWNIADLNDVKEIAKSEIVVTPNPLPTTKGEYTVTFTTRGTAADSKMKVNDTNIVLTANSNIVLTVDQAKAITATDLINVYAEASATLTGNTVNLTINDAASVQAIKDVKKAQEEPFTVVINAKAATGTDETQKTIKVYVFDEIDDNNKIAIKANDFILELGQVSEEKIKEVSGVQAWDLVNIPEGAPQKLDRDTIRVTGGEKVLGHRPVTFKATSGIRFMNYTVQGTVVNKYHELNKEGINAKGFDIALGELSEDNLIDKAGAEGWDLSDPSSAPVPVALTVSNPTEMPETPGVYPITFTTAKGTTHTVNANVVKTNITIIASEKIAITLKEAQEMTNEKFKTKAAASASHKNGLPVSLIADQDVLDELNNLEESQPTEYEVTLTSTVIPGGDPRDVTTKKVIVYVFDAIEGDYAIRANGFFAKESQVQTKEQIVAKASAVVYMIANNQPVPNQKDLVSVSINNEDVTKLGLGTNQQVKFYGEVTGYPSVTKTVHIYDDVETTTGHAIMANNFVAKVEDVKTEAQVVAAGDAKVYVAATGVVVPEKVAKTANYPLSVGQNQNVVFTYGADLSITKKANIFENYDTGHKETINAYDFVIELDSVNEANMIAEAKAKAYDVSLQPIISEIVDGVSIDKTATPIPTTLGKHAVKFVTDKGTTITVNAYIVNEINTDNEVAFDGHDFVIELGDINQTNLIGKAGVKAYDISVVPGQDPVDISSQIVASEPTEVGKQLVTYTVDNGAQYQVYAYVVTKLDGNIAFSGHDFVIKLEAVNRENVLRLSEFEALNVTGVPTNDPLNVTPSATFKETLPTTVGTHTITFVVLGKEFEVKAYIVDEINEDKELAFEGHDFAIKLADLVDKNAAISASGFKAFDISVVPGAIPTNITSEATTKEAIPTTVGTHVITFVVREVEYPVTAYVSNDIKNDISFSGHDFMIELDDMSEAKVLELSEFKAMNLSGLPEGPAVDATHLVVFPPTLPSTVGTHTITLEVSGETYDVKAYVVNEINADKEVAFEGHDFAIKLTDLVDQAAAVTASGFKAFDISVVPGAIPTDITSEATTKEALPTTVGTHTITFVVRGAEYPVTAYVSNDVQNDISFSGHDFVIELGVMSKEKVFELSEFKAMDLSGLPESAAQDITSQANLKEALPTTVGTHRITFVVGIKEYFVEAFVMSKIDPDKNVAFEGHDFAIKLADLVNIESAKSAAGFKAFDITNVPGAAPINLTHLATTKEALPTTVGTHVITFVVSGAEFEVTAYVSNDIKNLVSFSGHDFVINLKEMSEEKVLELSEFKAMNLSGLPTSPAVDITEHATFTLPTTVGKTTITFAVQGENYSVDAFVMNGIDTTNKVGFEGHDFAIKLADLVDINAAIVAADFNAFDISVVPGAIPTKITSEATTKVALPTTVGTHVITFVVRDAEFEVTAYVSNDINNKTSLSGHNFVIDLDDVSEEKLFELSEFKAMDLSGLPGSPAVDITDTAEITTSLPTTVGTHPVTFEVDGKPFTVQAFVMNDVNPSKKVGFEGHDFAIKLADLVSINAAISAADFKAFDISNVPGAIPTDITSEATTKTALPTTVGTHVITFVVRGAEYEVTAYVSNEIHSDISFSGHDFAISLEDVSRSNVIAASEFKAMDLSGLPGSPAVDVTGDAEFALPTTVGEHIITFEVDDESYTVTAFVSEVFNPETKIALTATDFDIQLEDVSESEFRLQSGIVAKDMTNVATTGPVNIATTLESALPTITGDHEVTFKATLGTKVETITVTAHVYNKIEGNLALNANDFVAKLEDVQSQAGIIAGAKVDVIDLATHTSVGTSNVLANPSTLQVGLNQAVTFTVNGTALAKAVQADVYDDYDETTHTAINASDFVAELDDVQTSNGIVEKAQAVVYDTRTQAPVNAKITATPNALVLGNNTVTIASGDLETVVTGTIFNKVDQITKESMNAHDFSIVLEDVSEAKFKELSGVKAYDVSDLEDIQEIPTSKVSVKSALPTTVGEHTVVFTTEKGTEYSVTATIRENGTVNPSVDSIFANGFTIAINDISKENLIAYANVVAFDESTAPATKLPQSAISIKGDLPKSPGFTTVTYVLASGTEVSVDVNVTATFDIKANDISMSLAQFNKAKADGTLSSLVLDLSNARAFVVETGEQVGPIFADLTPLAALDIKAGNTYEVELTFEVDSANVTTKTRALGEASRSTKQQYKVKIALTIPAEEGNGNNGSGNGNNNNNGNTGNNSNTGNNGQNNGSGNLPTTGVETNNNSVMYGSSLILIGLGLLAAILKKKNEEEYDGTIA